MELDSGDHGGRRPAPARAWIVARHGRSAAVFVGPVAIAVVLSIAFTPASPTPDVHAKANPIRTTYLSDCAVCHGAQGLGTERGPSLAGVGAASVDFQLSTGRMPLGTAGRSTRPGRPITPLPGTQLGDPDQAPVRHHRAYNPATIASLVSYVDQLTGGKGPAIPAVRPGNVAEGGTLYRVQCAACHAWAGDGGALLEREAPPLHQSTPVQIAEAIRVGPGNMPRFGRAALSDRQVDSVVAYVRYLDHPQDRGGNPLGHLGPVSEGAMALLSIGAILLFLRWIGERG